MSLDDHPAFKAVYEMVWQQRQVLSFPQEVAIVAKWITTDPLESKAELGKPNFVSGRAVTNVINEYKQTGTVSVVPVKTGRKPYGNAHPAYDASNV